MGEFLLEVGQIPGITITGPGINAHITGYVHERTHMVQREYISTDQNGNVRSHINIDYKTHPLHY